LLFDVLIQAHIGCLFQVGWLSVSAPGDPLEGNFRRWFWTLWPSSIKRTRPQTI